MSLGALIEEEWRKIFPEGEYTAKEAAELKNAIGKATTYAHQQGTTVFASAGNAALDFDHTNNLISLPSMAPHVITISATAPIGWAKGTPMGDGSFDHLASYSNFGQSAIQFAAPGWRLLVSGERGLSARRSRTPVLRL